MPCRLIALWAVLLPASLAFAGRPLTVDDAAPVEPGKFQLEAGVGFVKGGDVRRFDLSTTLAAGVGPGLEVGAAFGGTLEDRGGVNAETVAGVSDLGVGVKWRVVDLEEQAFSLALAPTLKLPTAGERQGLGTGETDFDLTLIVTQGVGPATAVDVNVGFTFVGEQDKTGYDGVLRYGLAVRHQLGEWVWVVGDVFAVTAVDAGAPTAAGCSVGVQYELSPGLVLDAAVGTGLYHGADLAATVGVTWVF
jgi:hypothetical protein